MRLQRGGRVWQVEVSRRRGNTVIQVEDQSFEGTPVQMGGGLWAFQRERKVHRAYVTRAQDRIWVALKGHTYEFVVEEGARRIGGVPQTQALELTAATPGKVVRVLVKEGDRVEAGQTVLILESMKMEMPIVVGQEGLVANVLVTVGQVVEPGQVLIKLAQPDEAKPAKGVQE